MRYYVMNSAVIPEPGDYRYALVSQADAATWLRAHKPDSRVGYPATAQRIRDISGITLPLNRDRSSMQPGDQALVVRLKYRLDNPTSKATWQPTPADWEYGVLTRLE